MPQAAPKRPRWVSLTLTLAPLWLIASAGVAVWLSLRSDAEKQQEQQQRFAQEMSVERIADDLQKLNTMVAPRHTGNAAAERNLGRAAAMIEGILGPSNTGYRVRRIAGPLQWPILGVTLESEHQNAASFWLLAAYDTAGDEAPAGPSSAVAALIATAQAMARDQLQADIHFVFLPHGNQAGAPVAEALRKAATAFPAPTQILCLEAMDHSPQLLVLAQRSDGVALRSLGELGRVQPATASQDLAAHARAAGLDAIQVRALHDPVATAAAPAQHVAVCAGKIVEWLRRCSNLSAAN